MRWRAGALAAAALRYQSGLAELDHRPATGRSAGLVTAAIGVQIHSLPLTPERVLRAMREGVSG